MRVSTEEELEQCARETRITEDAYGRKPCTVQDPKIWSPTILSHPMPRANAKPPRGCGVPLRHSLSKTAASELQEKGGEFRMRNLCQVVLFSRSNTFIDGVQHAVVRLDIEVFRVDENFSE